MSTTRIYTFDKYTYWPVETSILEAIFSSNSSHFRYFVAENDEVTSETERFVPRPSAPHATKTPVPDYVDDDDAANEMRRKRRILKFSCLAAFSLLMAGAALALSRRFPECSEDVGENE